MFGMIIKRLNGIQRKSVAIVLLAMLFNGPLSARLYLPDHLSLCSGYSLVFNTSLNDGFLQGFNVNADFGRSPSRVDKTYAFYYYVPLSYHCFFQDIHELSMGIGLRYLFSRTNLVNPYLGYECTFDQLYDGNYYYGIRNKSLVGVNIAKVDKPIFFLECSYHYSGLSRISNANKAHLNTINISAGIRFIIDRCDCPRF